MPKWEITPFEQFPQTAQLYLEQIEQELEAMPRRWEWLLEEKERMIAEIERQANAGSSSTDNPA